MKRTLERGLKVPEIVMEEPNAVPSPRLIHVDSLSANVHLLSTCMETVAVMKCDIIQGI